VDRKYITIKNGTIKGFLHGIIIKDNLSVSRGHLIEELLLFKNKQTGVTLQGDSSTIRNNRVIQTGGATAENVYGIHATGVGLLIHNNFVVKSEGSSLSYGISVQHAANCTIEFNWVCNETKDGITYAIYVAEADNMMVVNNRMVDWDTGIKFGSGATGKYRDNLTADVTTPYSGGSDAGNNQ
jgi:hypothetical protein